MAYWQTWINESGKTVYQENISEDYDRLLEDQPKDDGREVLVMRSIWLPIPRLSGVYKFSEGSWARILSLSDLGKSESPPDSTSDT